MLGSLTLLISLGTAIAAGLGYFSFWWTLIPAFIAGSFSLSNGPYYHAVVEANKRGSLWLFPTQLAIHIGGVLIGSGITFGLTRWISG